MTQRRRIVISSIAGVLAALCAALFLWGQAQSANRMHAELLEDFKGGAVNVMVARSRIEPGTLLSERLFEEQTWPRFCLPEGAIEAKDFEQIEGHRSAAIILKNEALAASRVFDRQLPADRLSEGMTAVTLPADDVHALGGELLRGMRLTLMAGTSDGRVSELASYIEVLSSNIAATQAEFAEASSDPQADESRIALTGGVSTQGLVGGTESLNWVTLAIPNEQVEQILTAARVSTLHFVLPREALSLDTENLEENSLVAEVGE
ncbi:MAG: RcpC/CpaB family pilus assembly protein [Coriobacteriia bacterium]|nr:RcpC/CpaB family pilus assembly protein [Coriobacteriia bacterium]MCL2870426.1 RcpC/CpaB family pilus assembly protein [Coriobacteriia bacterium]